MLRYDTATLCINGNEADYKVRCEVYIEGPQAYVDHELEVLMDSGWVAARDIAGMEESRVEDAEDALCQAALEDDTKLCNYEDAGEYR